MSNQPTCQTCAFRASLKDDSSIRQYCTAKKSIRSRTGYVRIQASDKACTTYLDGICKKLNIDDLPTLKDKEINKIERQILVLRIKLEKLKTDKIMA